MTMRAADHVSDWRCLVACLLRINRRLHVDMFHVPSLYFTALPQLHPRRRDEEMIGIFRDPSPQLSSMPCCARTAPNWTFTAGVDRQQAPGS